MADRVVYVEEQLPAAYVGDLLNAVSSMRSQVQQLDYEVAEVNNRVNGVASEFEKFLQQFRAYVAQDLMDRRYQEALTDQVSIQQQLDEKFSQHQRVRRYVTGILQASDSRLVRKETMQVATTELMIAIPHYWLVPALVALAAWLNDDRELAQKALREAMTRDDEKTCLLFALICRRASRREASLIWLRRYFAMQDPMDIERKMIVVLDAYANGLFGGDLRNLCAQQIGGWIAEMEDIVGFREAQVKRWEAAIAAKAPGTCDSSYPYLERYDNEELPLRRRERELELIIEERGNLSRAQERLASEQKALDEILDFTQLLTSAAMHADVIKASNATQRLAIALSKDWVISAYENTVLKIRQGLVQKFEMEIEGWKGETVDGSEEQALAASSLNYFSALRDREIANQQQSRLDIALPIICGALALISLFSANGTWALILGIGAGGLLLRWHLNRKKIEKIKLDIRERYAKIITDVKNTIKAILAEKVDFDRKIAQQDAVAEATLDYLQQIEAVQYVKHVEGRAFHNLEVG